MKLPNAIVDASMANLAMVVGNIMQLCKIYVFVYARTITELDV